MRAMLLKRLAPAVLLLASALAAPAAFLIKNAPDQETDLATGVTTLAKGGTVEDAKHGYTITASHLQFKNDDYLTARGATIKTRGSGDIKAASVDYRVSLDRLTASGTVSYSFEDLKNLRADRAVAYLGEQVIVALGNVSAAEPAASATAVVLDAKKRQLFLYGPFSFQGKGVNAKSSKADGTLLVTLPEGSGNAKSTTKVPAGDLSRYTRLIESSRK
jgi:hypothetical protein